jgi:DNA-binding NarL/FixJ family response regulator
MEVARGLISTVRDPLIESSFYAGYCYALSLAGRYEHTLGIVDELLSIIRRYRFDFALPYALGPAAIANAGLREWAAADDCLVRAEAVAAATGNLHAQQSCLAIRTRIEASSGRADKAPALSSRPAYTLPSTRGEILASHALVCCSRGEIETAEALLASVRGTTTAVETVVLTSAVTAVLSLKRNASSLERVAEFEETAFATGAIDILVVAYRSVPELLAILLRRSCDRERLDAIIRAARDTDLCAAAGYPVEQPRAPREQLTPRERDVYELLRQGLTNRQIAQALFITEATAKLHAHHIYDKLGIRSRTALAIQAALERRN